jgi:hypothetical protein
VFFHLLNAQVTQNLQFGGSTGMWKQTGKVSVAARPCTELSPALFVTSLSVLENNESTTMKETVRRCCRWPNCYTVRLADQGERTAQFRWYQRWSAGATDNWPRMESRRIRHFGAWSVPETKAGVWQGAEFSSLDGREIFWWNIWWCDKMCAEFVLGCVGATQLSGRPIVGMVFAMHLNRELFAVRFVICFI